MNEDLRGVVLGVLGVTQTVATTVISVEVGIWQAIVVALFFLITIAGTSGATEKKAGEARE